MGQEFLSLKWDLHFPYVGSSFTLGIMWKFEHIDGYMKHLTTGYHDGFILLKWIRQYHMHMLLLQETLAQGQIYVKNTDTFAELDILYNTLEV